MTFEDPRVDENLKEMAHTLADVKDSSLIEDFLYCLLTKAEIAEIAGRWALVKALQQKKSQREIAKDLGISLCKITRGSRELKKPNSAFIRIMAKL